MSQVEKVANDYFNKQIRLYFSAGNHSHTQKYISLWNQPSTELRVGNRTRLSSGLAAQLVAAVSLCRFRWRVCRHHLRFETSNTRPARIRTENSTAEVVRAPPVGALVQ